MAEVDVIREHFTSMARGEVPYTDSFRLIKKSVGLGKMKVDKVNASPMIGISPAQAAVEQSQNLIGEGQRMLQGVRKQYKKRKAPTKKRKPVKKRTKKSMPEEAF